jgi:DNA replication protein DnaC
MIASDLLPLLEQLKLHYLAAHLDDLVAEASRNRWGPLEIAEALVQRELQERQRRSVERRLRDARIGRFRPLADFDWSWPTHVDREQVERLLTLAFMTDDNTDNVILAAAQGLGKTMIAKNIAYQAVLAGHTVLFTTAGAMLLDLSQQDSSRALQSRIRRYTSPRLLVVDEVGYLSYDTRAADLLFEVVTRRYECGSILLTTNLSFKDWPQHFPGAGCVTAMIDRLTHHAEILTLEGKSYRLREADERQRKKRPRTIA